MYRQSYSLDADRNVADPASITMMPVTSYASADALMMPVTSLAIANSANIDNYSANQAPSGLSMMPTQLPAMSTSAFAPSYVPGAVNAPFATPYAIPFSAPELARQYSVAGRGAMAMQPPNLRATDNFSCSMVTIDGLERGQGCVVTKSMDPAVAVDLSGTNPYNFVNGSNKVNVTGDAQSQMCVVSYTDAFDTASFELQPNGRFQVCI